MDKQTLSQARGTFLTFLEEAEKCANAEEYGWGLAAMCTAFCVVLAIGEALCGGEVAPDAAIQKFYQQMSDKDSWIRGPNGNVSSKTIRKKLVGVRNGLNHAVALPDGVELVKDPSFGRADYCIIVPVFVQAVRDTVESICAGALGQRVLDPNGAVKQRSATRVVSNLMGGVRTTGQSA